MSVDISMHEFEWTDADFVKVQRLIYQKAGISLHDGKHAMVYSRLSRRLRDTGHTRFSDYLAWLESGADSEWQEFINALTTNLTSFFRERHHFQTLKEHLLSKHHSADWKVWCCASSTGEEPYSIAMTCLDVLAGKGSFNLLASDIDSKVLMVAGNGVYRQEDLKNVSDEYLKRFFLKGKNKNAGLARIKPEVQKYVRFVSINLASDSWPLGQVLFDVVFCRNVMIYFDASTQRRVLERVHKLMVPGGLLFVGHAENFSDLSDLFLMKGKTVYERV